MPDARPTRPVTRLSGVLLLLGSLGSAACDSNTQCGVEGGHCETFLYLNHRARGGAPETLAWAVYRDGDGPWQQIPNPGWGSQLVLKKDSPGMTVAFVCKSTMLGEVIHMADDELSSLDVFCGIPYSDPGQLTLEWRGAIKGAGSDAKVTLVFGSWWEGPLSVPLAAGAGDYKVRVLPRQHDVAALAESPGRPPRLLLRHNLSSQGAGGVADLDFEVGALVPQEQMLALPMAAPGEQLQAGVTLTTKERAFLELPLTGANRVPVFAQRDLADDDLQELQVSAGGPAGLRGVKHRLVDGPMPKLQLPPAFNAAEVARGPAALPKASFDAYPEASFYQMTVSPLGAAPTFTWVINVGARWLASRTLGSKQTLEFPELSTLPGFDPAWAPDAKQPSLIELTAVTSSRRFGELINDSDRFGAPAPELTTYAKQIVSLPPAAP